MNHEARAEDVKERAPEVHQVPTIAVERRGLSAMQKKSDHAEPRGGERLRPVTRARWRAKVREGRPRGRNAHGNEP